MLIGVAGLSVIERYLIVAALALLVFAAVGVGGFTMLRPGRLRTGWMVTSIVLVLAGVIFTATRVDLTKLTNELQFRGDAHASLVSVLHKPAVERALRCGPLTAPNHKLVPDARWILDLPRDRVLARADPDGPHPRRGVGALRHEPLRRSSATPSPTPSTRPPSRSRRTAGGGSRRATTSPPMPAAERRWLWPAGVAALVLGALGLRLWGFRHGLPFVYNADENAHFVAGAIGMFGHTYNPNYFINPPGFTYLLHAAFALGFGGRDGVSASYAADPSNVFALARALSGVLGAVAVGLLAWAGARLFDRRIGFVAAAVLAVAFLPVHYAHLALNDVPTLAPLCLALVGVGGVFARGRLLDYALAGVGLGFACATKYTGGIVLLPLLAAALVGRDQAVARRLGGLALAGALALAAFLIANPFALLDFDSFRDGLSEQSAASSDGGGKLGLTASSGIVYYLGTTTWGLGWLPALAALGGAVVLAVRDWRRALVLVPPLVLFLLFMGTQDRYFARWLLPVYPFLAPAGRLRRARRRSLAAAPGAGRSRWRASCCARRGSCSRSTTTVVLARDDTRQLARDWMVKHVPAGTKVVIEPVMPDSWASDPGRALRGTTGNGARWAKWPTSRSRINPDGTLRKGGLGPIVKLEDYERTLFPQLVRQYAERGYCTVLTGSTQFGRALAEPEDVPRAIKYYDELKRERPRRVRRAPARARRSRSTSRSTPTRSRSTARGRRS